VMTVYTEQKLGPLDGAELHLTILATCGSMVKLKALTKLSRASGYLTYDQLK
jgi:hypothetical protein